jgi:hypothetical protein
MADRGIAPIQSDRAIKLANPENTSQYISTAYFLVGSEAKFLRNHRLWRILLKNSEVIVWH